MFKPLAALIAALTISVPAVAKVDPGTVNLLQTLNEYGVSIQYNPSDCGSGFMGRYNTRKVMTLCYRGAPTASDHDTVRHETAHFLQHCASIQRGEPGLNPLAVNPTKRNHWVTSVLKPSQVRRIKSSYSPTVHQIELEAFAMAQHYTANDLIKYIKAWCIKP